MTKQARNYSIKNDSMSYFPWEQATGPPTDASGIYRGWTNLSKQSAARPVPEKGVRGGSSLRAGEEQAQQKEGRWLHSKSMRYADRALQQENSNQIASPEPCPSVGVTIHTCKSTSTEQRLKGRGRQKTARGKDFSSGCRSEWQALS